MSPLPPGPTEPPVIQTLRWLLRPISFLESCRRSFGDAFSVRFLGFRTPLVMLSHPDAIRALYGVREHGLPPGRTVALLPIVGPRSLLLLEGREHLARRRVMLPPFHGERMRAYESIVRDAVARDVERWPVGQPFAIHPRMQSITLDVILRAVFGITEPARRADLAARLGRLLASTSSVGLQFGVLLSRRLGGPDPLARLQTLRSEIDGLLAEEIAERRGDAREDILSMLVSARFEDGEPMGDGEIRDQLMTLLLAGHETTATGLAWTFDLLLRHPRVLDRLVAEVDAGEEAYLRAVVAESLRLRPVVPLAGRRLSCELRVNGHVLPPGTDVTPAIWLAHTRVDRYPEPFAFRPERFLASAPATYAWIPFGGGVRRCLGAAFAEMEMRVALAEILRRRALRPASAAAERVARRNVTFSPRTGTRVLAAARGGSPLSRPDDQTRPEGARPSGPPRKRGRRPHTWICDVRARSTRRRGAPDRRARRTRVLEALALSGDERVPELGTGLGYQAAVPGRLARDVWSVERRPELAAATAANLAAEGVENVHVSAGDSQREGAGAPYDAIVVAHADEQSRVALGSVRARRPGRTPLLVQGGYVVRHIIPSDDEKKRNAAIGRSRFARQALAEVDHVDRHRVDAPDPTATRSTPSVSHAEAHTLSSSRPARTSATSNGVGCSSCA